MTAVEKNDCKMYGIEWHNYNLSQFQKFRVLDTAQLGPLLQNLSHDCKQGFLLFILLKYSWFTKVCYFQV